MSRSFDNVLVVGCGYVGQALALQLFRAGKNVCGIKRNIVESTHPFRVYQADVLQPESLHAIPQGVENIVYAVSPSGRSEKDYKDAYINGFLNLSKHLQKHCHCSRVLLTSSTGVFDTNDGSWVDEETELTLESWKSNVLWEAEKQLQQLWNCAATVRFGGIYGPGRNRMISIVKDSQVDFDLGFPVYTNRIHRDDCARTLEHLLSVEELEEVYIGVDSEPATKAQLFNWIADELKLEKAASSNWSAEKRAELGQGKRCSNKRLLQSGFSLVYPSFREGYSAQLNYFR